MGFSLDATLGRQSTRPLFLFLFCPRLCILGLVLPLCISRSRGRVSRSRSSVLRLRLATMQSLVGLGHGLVEGLTLSFGDSELKGSWLAGSVGTLKIIIYQILSNRLSAGSETYSESTSTPCATAVDFIEVGELREHGLVAQRNIDETVVSESAHGGKGS